MWHGRPRGRRAWAGPAYDVVPAERYTWLLAGVRQTPIRHATGSDSSAGLLRVLRPELKVIRRDQPCGSLVCSRSLRSTTQAAISTRDENSSFSRIRDTWVATVAGLKNSRLATAPLLRP